MIPALTFVVPVRHQDNASDWEKLVQRLSETIRSITSQSSTNWRAIVVANEGAVLPVMPPGFHVERVSFAPNPTHDMAAFEPEIVYDNFRADKGRRVLAGMLAAGPTDYFMIVDDDDFVSAQLTGFVTDGSGANGWEITKGWLWSEGEPVVMRHDDFNNFCGTSLIIRADLYQLPGKVEDAAEDYIKFWLGSHIRIAGILRDRGSPLAPLPFRGAVYRLGHSGAHSKSAGVLRQFIVNRTMLKRPKALLGNLLKLNLVTGEIRREFFGGTNPRRPTARVSSNCTP